MLPRHLWDLARSFLERRIVQFHEKADLSLKHGGADWIYFDLRAAENSRLGAGTTTQMGKSIGDHLDDLIRKNDLRFDAIAGVPYAGDPFAEVLGSIVKKPVIRLEKDRDGNVGGFRTNPSEPEATVLLVENVTTSGISATNALRFFRDVGYVIHDVLTVIDRESGAKQLLNTEGVRLWPIMRMGELLDFYIKKDEIPFKLCALAKEHARQLNSKPPGPLQ